MTNKNNESNSFETKLPQSFKEEMQTLLKEEYPKFMDSYMSSRHYGLRLNLNKIKIEEFIKIKDTLLKDLELTQIPWCQSGFYYQGENRPAKNPLYHGGLYYIQEPSAMSPVELMDIKKGMKVLDLCSAPGGKATQIAGKLEGEGIVVANDISAQRIKAVLKNFEIQGITNALITNAHQDKMAKVFENYFDRILLDVPCSGEGMFRKDTDLIKSYQKSRIDSPIIQREILPQAEKMLKPGGLLMYSTCTFNLEENEEQIQNFLEEYPNFEIVSLEATNGFVPGYLEGSLRLFPHKTDSEGHFLCLLKKKETEYIQNDITEKFTTFDKLPDEFQSFVKENMTLSEIEGNYTLNQDKIYKELNVGRDLKGLKIVRNGLYMGELKNKTFLPSSAFIMSTIKSDWKNTIDLKADDPILTKYLKCETLEFDMPKGMYIICVEGYPLGYGKINNGSLKNYYNKNWRLM